MKQAILVIDVQNDYCSSDGKVALNFDVTPIQKMVERLNKFLEESRNFNVPLIFVRMDKSFANVPDNLLFKMNSSQAEELCVPGTKGFEYYKIKPLSGDREIVKNSYDAFTNEKLSKLLVGVKDLIVLGCYTDICVDATVKAAFSKGYNVFVPEDLVATVNSVNLESLNKFAFITNSNEILQSWKETYINLKQLI